MSVQTNQAAANPAVEDDKSLEHARQVGDDPDAAGLSRPQDLEISYDDDPEMQSYLKAKEEVDAADAAKAKPDDEPKAPVEGEEGYDPNNKNLPDTTDKSGIMVPKARLDEVIADRESHKGMANYYKGLYDATKQMQGSATQPVNGQQTQPDQQPQPQTQAQPQITVEQYIGQIDQAKVDLAQKYDDGELTAAEWKKQEAALDGQLRNALNHQTQQQINNVKTETIKTARDEDHNQVLNHQAVELEQKHPYCNEIKDSNHWKILNGEASRTLIASGFTAEQLNTTLEGKLAFRETIARLTDVYGPIWTGKQLTAPQGQPAQTANANASPSQTAAQRQAKIDLANQQPPSSGNMGTASGGATDYTSADIERMSDDDIANLPAAVRNRILGITA